MERWEVKERRVLIAVGIVLISLCVWLVMDGKRAFLAILLTPIVFWIFWQAFFEDKLGSNEPVSRAERLMHGTLLWGRRLVIGGIALVLAAMAFKLALDGTGLTAVLLPAVLSLFAGWVSIFGAGRAKSMSDDLQIHRERQKRYRKP
ncbi:MAG: hypothetical protein QE495_14580 [Acidovorax sp.]|uniref:hypothetical protein n=1 Tax=Acidovorax sp. TaxID=1872122 RepID=UPI00260A3C23|nr:hypothetical protein [Acidovorax sp.]MDH4427677.1 hypothetical protein [Acidovorax sp.]